jgi:hypothetical protein
MWTVIGIAAAALLASVLIHDFLERKRAKAIETASNRERLQRLKAANDNDVRHRPNRSTG